MHADAAVEHAPHLQRLDNVAIVTGDRSVLFKRIINPSLENDTDVVLPPPCEAAYADCEKFVERDVEVCRKKA